MFARNVSAPSRRVTQMSDLVTLFARDSVMSPTTLSPGFEIVSTPYGPGFKFTVSDTLDVAAWDSTLKAILARVKQPGVNVVMGTTQQWDFWAYVPTQTIIKYGGLIWEFHTTLYASGQAIGIDNNPSVHGLSWQPAYETGGGSSYTYAYDWDTSFAFDTWTHFRIKVLWSLGSDGLYQVYRDGALIQHKTGATVYSADGGTPYLQFGYYANIGSQIGLPDTGDNVITFAGITMTG